MSSQLEKQAQSVLNQFIQRAKNHKHAVDTDLYELLTNLFSLIDSHKQNDLGLGDGGPNVELQKRFIDYIFILLFCQNTYNAFFKTDLSKKDMVQILNQKSCQQKENIDIQNVKKASNRDFQPLNLNSNLNKVALDGILNENDQKPKQQRNLYDVCYDLAIYILLKMIENEDGDVNYDLASSIINAFVKHIRIHFQSAKFSYCLPSVLAMYKLLTYSRHLLSIAKDKDLINKLFGIMPYFFREEAKSISQGLVKDINLNQLVIGQGGYQQPEQHQQQAHAQSVKHGSSTQLQYNNITQSPANQDLNKQRNKKPVIEKKALKKKLSFNRAASEPPSANKNAVVPVQEDSNDDSSIDYDQKGGQEIEKEGNGGISVNSGDKTAPPLLINQSSSNPLSLQQQNSSSVMTNYFNVPLGAQNPQSNSKGFKLNFYPQNTLAKSRLTRRQMSMSRKNTQKLSSMTNLVALAYGDDTTGARNANNDFGGGDSTTQNRDQYQNVPSFSNVTKKPTIPKLNINSIIYDNNVGAQRIDPLILPTTSHVQHTHNKSSNRSNKISPYSNNLDNQFASQTQSKVGGNMLTNYQTNANVIKQGAVVGDSEQNASIYDEGNGSFAMEDANGRYLYDNAEEKLRQLAISLGESCLTHDLAALISQKRELELVESARKTVIMSKEDQKEEGQEKSHKFHRSISVAYTHQESGLNPNFSKKQDRRSSLGDFTAQSEQNQIKKRVRLVILNIVNELLKKYDIEEARFLKHPINVFNAYIGSDQFRNKRYLDQIRQLECGSKHQNSKKERLMIQHTNNSNNENDDSDKEYDINCKGILRTYTYSQNDTEPQYLNDLMGRTDTEENKKQTNQTNQSMTSLTNDNLIKQSVSSKLKTIIAQNIFKGLVQSEEKVIFKIYKKFSFVNEDILRRQVLNELACFASKDKGFEAKFFNTLTSAKFNPNSSFLNPAALNSIGGPALQIPLSGTPVRQFNNLSFDEDNEEFYFRKEKNVDAIQTLSNPNILWTNNGIAYDLNSQTSSKSTASSVSKESIRKKLDVLLYTVDRRMKYAIQQFYDKTSYEFADLITKEVVTLSTYLEQQRTRIMLYQVIEVNIESLLMIKKCLIENSLKTNMYVMDFTKANNDMIGVQNLNQFQGNNQTNILIEAQKKHRELFSEYLKLISILLSLSQTQETMKLLNEVLVFDESWQESVKTFTISLFLQDLVSIIVVTNEKEHAIMQAIEELRGINILNFDEASFLNGIMKCQDVEMYSKAKDSVYHTILCALNVIKYYKAVTKFFAQAIQMYFSHFETQSKAKDKDGAGSMPNEGQSKDAKLQEVQDRGRSDAKYSQANANIQNYQQLQKYWKHVIRRVLYQFMFLITPPNGLLSQYLTNNAINYLNIANSSGSSSLINKNSSDNVLCPINFRLTKSILNFNKTIFNIPDRFTKYVFIEEVMLFYIRTHYISFVRLYNKNFTKKHQAVVSKETSLQLCKKHIECLFSLAKNRNEDTRRKFYQFMVVQFLCQEIELEFEVQQRRKRFLQLSKEEQVKIIADQNQVQEANEKKEVIQQSQMKPKTPFSIPALKISGLTLSELQPAEEIKQEETKVIEQPKFKVPMLKIKGLGLSELTQDAPQQEEQKSQHQVSGQLKMKIPPLKIGGLGLSTLQKDEENKQEQPAAEEMKSEQIKKPLIPALKIGGLGLSTLQKDEETQKQEEVPEMVIPKSKIPNLNITGLGLSDIQPDAPSQEVIQQQKFAPPKIPALKIGGLGLSTLKPDDSMQQQQVQFIVEEQKQPQLQEAQEQPTLSQVIKPKIPALKIQGLGLSTLKQDTQEQSLPPQQQQEPQQEQKQQVKPVMKIPKLNVAGLGITGLVLDKNEASIQNQQKEKSSRRVVKLSSIRNVQHQQMGEVKHLEQENQMTGLVQQVTFSGQDFQTEPPHLKGQLNTQVQTLHQTIDYAPEDPLFSKQKQQFDKTAPLNQMNDDPFNKGRYMEDEEEKQQPLDHVSRNYEGMLIKESVESAQFISNAKLHKITCIPEEQIDESKREKLKQSRKNLIPPRLKINSKTGSSDYDEIQGIDKSMHISQTPSQDYMNQHENQFNPMNRANHLSAMTIGTQMNVESVADINSNNTTPLNQLQPPSSNQTPNGSSARSNGSFIGRNKIFVPFLKFPEDIHVDPAEIINRYHKPDEGRFKLIKTKDSVSKEGITPENLEKNQNNSSNKPKQMGKRGKMLDINPSSSNQEIKDESSTSKKTQENHFTFKNIKSQQQQQQETLPQNIPEEEKKQEEPREIQRQPSLKKPLIPSLKIPEKGEQPEGKEKIKQQIELQEQLNVSMEGGNLTKLEQSLNQNSKFQLLLDHKNRDQSQDITDNSKSFSYPATAQQQQKEVYLKPKTQELSQETLMSESMFYLKERGARPIYQDEELHVLMISLMMCLLLKPQRGTLDDLYCNQYPIDNGKTNIMYLLHFHLNHPENQSIIPQLLRKVSQITPPLAGQRLIKLLCTSLFDLSLYNNGKDWKKIAEGAYAQVYECQTNLSEPQYVAIKQMNLPNSIYDRCVLHDIFTEITCLEEFRLEPCVTDLYDYGVHGSSYYIVMKKYHCSLREWRLKQTKPLSENLSLYLSIYREVLKSMAIIHSHNVTHYDMKCDNVLLELGGNQYPSSLSKWNQEDEEKMKITIGDFGECKIFLSETDEMCIVNRGTDYCKSPEMLQLAINTRKDTDKYDRRKQVGTNRLSDIWSAGCLLYELLTGEYLFYTPDYCEFLFRVTRHHEALFTADKLEKISNNIYLIDFLKYMLVRDNRLRPSIENVLKRFEHVHALLVTTSSANGRFNLISSAIPSIRGQPSIDSLLEQTSSIMMQNSQVYGGEIKEEIIQINDQEAGLNISQSIQQLDEEFESQQIVPIGRKTKSVNQSKLLPLMMRIMEDLFLSSHLWIRSKSSEAIALGITHIIIDERLSSQSLKDSFDVLEVPESAEYLQQSNIGGTKMNPFLLMPLAMDFLRRAALQKGRVLFVENHNDMYSNNNEERQAQRGVSCQLIRECLLLCLNSIYQTNAYETYALIKSQNLFFKIESQRLATISKYSMITSKVNQYMATFPKFQCQCGSCVIILKRQYANYANLQAINCNCCQYYKNIETSQCPTPGCNEFMQYLKIYFKVQYESLNWGFVDEEDFIIGPNYIGSFSQNSIQHRWVLGNMSQTIDKNSQIVSIIEKKSGFQGKDNAGQDYNLISKSSATAKNYYYPGYARWKLFKCKECHVWTHAINETENKYAVLLNNRVKESKAKNLGLMNVKQEGSSGIRVPILQKIKLKIPF